MQAAGASSVADFRRPGNDMAQANALIMRLRDRWPQQSDIPRLISAGMATAIVSISISMAYGVVAFAPFGSQFASYGVAAGLFGAIVSSLLLLPFGARTPLGAGPRAASVVIFAALCSRLLGDEALLAGNPNPEMTVLAVGFLAMALAGLIQGAASVARTGLIVKYIPYPVVAGYINGSMLLIILGQAWPMLGLERAAHFTDLFRSYSQILPLALIPGLGAIGMMYLVSRRKIRIPGPLAGILAGTLIHHALAAVWPGAPLGGTLQELDGWLPLMPLTSTDGLNALASVESIGGLFALVLPAALSMAVISSFDTVFAITAMDDLRESRTDANRELMAHGFANFGAALLGGIISSGGLNRAKPAIDAGAQDARVHPVTGLMMLLAVIFLSDWLSYIPLSVIGGVIVYICAGLFDLWMVRSFIDVVTGRASSRLATSLDIGIIVLVIVIALRFDLIVAVAAGTALSVILFVAKISRSPVKNVANGSSVHSLRIWDPRRQEILDAEAQRIALVKLQGPIFFGTADNLEAQLESLLQDGPAFIVLDFKAVTDIDISGTRVLLRVHRKIRKAGGLLVIAYVKRNLPAGTGVPRPGDPEKDQGSCHIWETLESAGVVEAVGIENFVFDNDTGLARCETRLIELFEGRMPVRHARQHKMGKLAHNLSLRDFRILRHHLVRREYAVGETIFEQGQEDDTGYFLVKGAIEIRLGMGSGHDTKLLQSLLPGAVFGEIALLDHGVRSASAVATEKSVCYLLSVRDFAELRERAPGLTFKMLNWVSLMFAQRLRNADKMIIDLEM